MFGAITQEVSEHFVGDIGGGERIKLFAEQLEAIGRNGGFGIDGVDVAGVVGHDGNLLVAQGALRPGSEVGAVEPHVLGHKPTVVGQHTVVHVNEVLRV